MVTNQFHRLKINSYSNLFIVCLSGSFGHKNFKKNALKHTRA